MQQASDTDNGDDTTGNGSGKRKWLLIGLGLVFAAAAAAYGAYWLTVARFYAETDDAYVHGNRIMLTPQISGTAIAIHAEDSDRVERGQPVVELDQSNTRVALDQAEARLGQTVRQVRERYEHAAEQQALVKMRKTQLAQAKQDYERDHNLLKIHGIPRKDFQHTRTALRGAKARVAQARHKLGALEAGIDNTDLRHHPEVKEAVAQLRMAYLNQQRTTIPAPVGGYVAKRSVQVGEKVDPETPMLAIVPLDSLWVQANFKETQMTDMRIGQPVAIHADFYGGEVTYNGKVAGLSPGTGSAFELLPPQNATGNWIKIVRRVPVRIRLQPEALKQHPLRLGLSLHVSVDTHDTSGPVLAANPPSKPVYATDVYRRRKHGLHALVEGIISANDGQHGGDGQHGKNGQNGQNGQNNDHGEDGALSAAAVADKP